MSQETVEQTPALTASQASWRCVQAGDKDGWLALMADDVVIEDPIGPAVHQPRRHRRARQGRRFVVLGAQHRARHHHASRVRRPSRRVRPTRSPTSWSLRFTFDNGSASAVRGIFTYKVNDAGLLTNLRGYWNMDMMKPVKGDGGD